ncbi:hypothetical protein FFLO_04666 [Filobasidium floriforme]|uniref:Potassium transporter n=1 Tax=Filobasidium floriforme TaxID=5210 RepID=A0A8K0JJY6_9TREE|nr:hypothetical protein FFLO_04666 [Filobasidium floriforme]
MSTPAHDTEGRQALRLGGRKLAFMAFSSLGIIYSDIGTSPLYVLTTIFSTTGPAPNKEDIIGGISAIVWAFTLLPLLKYIGFALSFGSGEGEGGPFALYQQIFPRDDPGRDPNDDRELTKHIEVVSHGKPVVSRSSRLQKLRWPLQIWTLFATALTMADGILTPAVSVTSSVGGLAVVAPVVSDHVIPISIGFLLVLFLGQRFGTAKLSIVFAPLTFLWFALIGISGIINVASQPSILRAFDPSRAIMFFVRTKNYDALAGVLLALTGCEAIFANLGQFTASSIRISFVCLVYPALIFQYLGQGARIITDGTVMANPFYLSIPGGPNGGLWWITWVMGVIASLIASQAMITATFTLVNQLIGMGAFPSIRINHTSILTAGQVYVPAINWLLMIGTIATVAGFGSSFALTLAYGFAVATVMFITTTLLAFHIPLIKGYHWSLGVLFFLFFGFLDALFWGAALRKVPEGAWFPLALGSVLCIFMVFWTWGQELERIFDTTHSRKLNSVVFNDTTVSDIKSETTTKEPISEVHEVEHGLPVLENVGGSVQLQDRIACDSHGDFYIKKPDGTMFQLARTTTTAIFYKPSGGQGVPHAFSTFLHQVPALPRIIIFLSTWTVARPHVELADRYFVTKARSLDGFYGVTMKRGYLDRISPEIEHILGQIQTIEAIFSPVDVEKRLARIAEASKTVTHINSSYRLISRHQNNGIVDWVRRALIEELYDRCRVMFPDESSSPESLEETLHLKVIAEI